MQNIVFDRHNLKCKGLDRFPLPYEFSIYLPYPILSSKKISEQTSNQVQKTNLEGNLLYKDNIQVNEFGLETFHEVIYSEKVIKTEIVVNQYKIVTENFILETITNELGEEQEIQIPIYTTIETTSEIPIEYEQLQPIMINEVISKTYIFPDNYLIFDYNSIIEAKKQAINNNNLLSLCFYDEDFLGNDLVLSGCSIGDGILILHPQGFITTPIITLTKFTSIIGIYQESQNSGLEFYINDIPVIDGRIKLSTNVNEIIIKVSNPTNKNLELYCLGGLC